MYINNANQTSSFWRIYKELQRNVSPVLSQISPQRNRYSRSFEQQSKPIFEYNKDKSHHQKSQRIIKSPTILTQFGIPANRIQKVERADIMDIISQTSIDNQQQNQQQLKKGRTRRVTQYEQMSQKQKRLNNIAPHTQVYQHSHEAIIVKKKKINRLKNQYKFLQRSKQRKKNGQFKSKSCPLLKIPKITHKRAQTTFTQYFQGYIQPIDTELHRKIALLLYKKRNSLIQFRRRTCIQEQKTFIALSKEKLLHFQELLQQQFKKTQQNQQEASSPQSSVYMSSMKKINNFNFIDKFKEIRQEKQKLTPRQVNEQISSLITRRTSHQIVEKYIKQKVIKQEYSKSPVNLFNNTSNLQIGSPSLNDINQYFLSQKRRQEKEIKFQTNSIHQSIKKSIVQKQQFLDLEDSQKIKSVEDRIQNTSLKKPQQNQLISACRIRTLPSEHQQQQKKKQYYFLKLKPYYQ